MSEPNSRLDSTLVLDPVNCLSIPAKFFAIFAVCHPGCTVCLHFPETREEHIERMRNTPIHLFRLRYYGDEDEWGLAFYSYAHNKYETSVFPNGAFFGTPELALETSAGFHL